MDTYTLGKSNRTQDFDTLRELIVAANNDPDDGQTRHYYRNGEPFSDGDYAEMEREQRRMVSEVAAVMGRRGGSVKSERKAASSAANGRKGGRPRKTQP